MPTVNDIMFSPVKRPPEKWWSLLMDRHSHRVLWFEKGMRLGHFTSKFASVALIGEPPAATTRDNCREFVLRSDRLVQSPQLCRQVGQSIGFTGKQVNS